MIVVIIIIIPINDYKTLKPMYDIIVSNYCTSCLVDDANAAEKKIDE